MVHITIAGSPNDPDLARAEMLAYHLQRNLPDFSVSIQFIPAPEWTNFVQSRYQQNGWSIRLARDRTVKKPESLGQLIWYTSGELIGNTADFLKHVKKAYNMEEQIDSGLLKQIAMENAQQMVC